MERTSTLRYCVIPGVETYPSAGSCLPAEQGRLDVDEHKQLEQGPRTSRGDGRERITPGGYRQ